MRRELSRWLGQIDMMVSTTDSLNLMLPSSFRQSERNFNSTPAFPGILVYNSLVELIISILKSIPRSGKKLEIYFSSFYTDSSLHVFNRVEIARDATDLFKSVIKASSSV